MSLKRHEQRVGLALVLPALLAFGVMILWPFVQSFRLAFYKYTLDMSAPAFVGLANFQRLLTDPGMGAAVWRCKSSRHTSPTNNRPCRPRGRPPVPAHTRAR